jgi:hypothetical protein
MQRNAASGLFTKSSCLAFYSCLCLLNQIDECRQFVPRDLPGKTLPLCRRQDFPQVGFHGKKCLPASDRPMTGQVSRFRSAVGKIQLMPEPRTPDFQMIVLMHGAAPLNVQKNTPVSFFA